MRRTEPMRRTRSCRGSAIVEMAMAIPVLLIFSFIAGEGAGLVRAHIVLNNAAREGAHLSAMPENDCDQLSNSANITPAQCRINLRQAVVDYAGQNGLTVPLASVTLDQNKLINLPNGTVATGSEVVVTFSYTLRYLPALPYFNIASSVPLKNAAEFQNLY